MPNFMACGGPKEAERSRDSDWCEMGICENGLLEFLSWEVGVNLRDSR